MSKGVKVRLKSKQAIILVFALLSLLGFEAIPSAKPQYLLPSPITINADGIVTGTDRIVRMGSLYALSSDLFNSPITVECNNIQIDGKGHSLTGAGFWEPLAAINLTCSNVTVKNFQITNWQAGILGAYDNNTILDNSLIRNERNIAVYANNYNVNGNYIRNGSVGVRIKGNNSNIEQNHIVDNAKQFWISQSTGTTIAYNTIEANDNTIIQTDCGNYKIYQNNIILNMTHSIIATSYAPEDKTKVVLPPWDNGKVGNYWSDHQSKYPNAQEIGNSGIATIPYLIDADLKVSDRYPLTSPVNISSDASPLVSPSSSSSPSSTVPELLFAAISVLAIVTVVSAVLLLRRSIKNCSDNQKGKLVMFLNRFSLDFYV